MIISFSLYCDMGSRARARINQTTLGLAKHLFDVHIDIVSCRGSSCRGSRGSLRLGTTIGAAAKVVGHLLVQLLLRFLRSCASPAGLSVLATGAAVPSLATSARTTTPALSSAPRHRAARVPVLSAALAGHVAVYVSAGGQRSRPRDAVGQRSAWHVCIVKGIAPRGGVHDAEADRLSCKFVLAQLNSIKWHSAPCLSSTFRVCAVKLAHGFLGIVSAVVSHVCDALGAACTIVHEVELKDRPNLGEEALLLRQSHACIMAQIKICIPPGPPRSARSGYSRPEPWFLVCRGCPYCDAVSTLDKTVQGTSTTNCLRPGDSRRLPESRWRSDAIVTG